MLNDYHFLSDPRIHDATEFLLDHLPPQVCLVIATRTDPPLALSRLRAGGQLLEVRGGDLRFDLAEVAHLNGSQGLDLSQAALASLEAQTEGWIAALQLAALSLAERPDKERFVEAFAGSHRFLVGYLVDEVLSRQPAHIKTFLQRTAILERFSESSAPGAPALLINAAPLSATTFTDPLHAGLLNRYFYRVSALNTSEAESARSEAASATLTDKTPPVPKPAACGSQRSGREPALGTGRAPGPGRIPGAACPCRLCAHRTRTPGCGRPQLSGPDG